MSFYILLYVTVIFSLFYIVFISYNRYIKLIFGRYFLVGLLTFSLWLLLYLIAFTSTFNPDVLLYFSRGLYALSFIASYSMLLYFWYYGRPNSTTLFSRNIHFIVIFCFASILYASLFSGLFIEEMIYDPILEIHYESFGPWFVFLQIFYVLNPFILLSILFYRYHKLLGVRRLRFKYIGWGYAIFLSNYAFFLAILPIFGIWIFQKEQIIFFIPFLIMFLYSFYRYKFTRLSLGLGKISVYIFSIIITLVLIYSIKEFSMMIDERLIAFWGIEENFSWVDIILGILIFYFIHRSFSSKLLKINGEDEFRSHLLKLREKVPFLQNFTHLNTFLENGIQKSLGIPYSKIIYGAELEKYSELISFFQSNISNDLFLNDYVFIEEHKNRFDKNILSQELDKKIGMYIPLYSQNSIVGFFCIGRKRFGDFYTGEEIDALLDLSYFLEGHIKYISIYSKIHELNVTLDRKVDEKTIEFNTLINKQKEFIAFVSHEIKNPVTNTIFLADSLKSDIQAKKEYLLDTNLIEDADLLNNELIKISELTKTIFSIEKYDIHGMKLYKEPTDFHDFIDAEIRSITMNYPNIDLHLDLQKVGILDIDHIQFRQVLTNIIGNSIKFLPLNKAMIHVSLIQTTGIELRIEDNGKGFYDINIEHIFDKYTTGESGSSGLGMGLYLCKKIVELHGGKIIPLNSQKLKGACFVITL